MSDGMAPEFKAEAIQELKNLGENVAACTAKSLFKIIEIAVKNSTTPIDDMAVLPILPVLEKVTLEFIDKISDEQTVTE